MTDDLREVLLTLTHGQFESFARDLELLRDQGAAPASNTDLVLGAVRALATTIEGNI